MNKRCRLAILIADAIEEGNEDLALDLLKSVPYKPLFPESSKKTLEKSGFLNLVKRDPFYKEDTEDWYTTKWYSYNYPPVYEPEFKFLADLYPVETQDQYLDPSQTNPYYNKDYGPRY